MQLYCTLCCDAVDSQSGVIYGSWNGNSHWCVQPPVATVEYLEDEVLPLMAPCFSLSAAARLRLRLSGSSVPTDSRSVKGSMIDLIFQGV